MTEIEQKLQKCSRCSCKILQDTYFSKNRQGQFYKTCNVCRGNRVNIRSCREFAISKGGECLSTEYKNIVSKMKWKCSSDHTWEANFSNIKNGSWCPNCAGKKKLTIEECKNFAISKDGECLSTEYKNTGMKMKWKCSESHEWLACFSSIKHDGNWCSECSGNKKLTISECKEFAISKGGECLSTEYKNNHTKLMWKCSEGHKWEAVFNHIKSGKWCPDCSGVKKLTIEECKEFAETKDGECLSTDYKNSGTKMRWKCSEDHEWRSNFHNIKKGTWCPECSAFRSENLACKIIEEESEYKWKKIRPKWLGGLELDGYCKELKIAFEYQGIQHYEYRPFFHKNKIENFHKQQERDTRKLKLAAKKGIDMILIPYHFNYKNPEEMRTYIKDELIRVIFRL